MRRVLLLIALLPCLAAPPSMAATKRADHPCRQGAAIRRNNQALVFALRWGLYGCLRSDMRVQHIFSGDPRQSLGGAGFDMPTVYGSLVAFGTHGGWKCGAWTVVLYDLARRKVVQQVPAGTVDRESSANGCDDSGTGPVRSLVLWRNGTMAFIAGRVGEYEVGVVDATGMRSIVVGTDIDPLSVGRGRATVTWRQGGEQRSAPFGA